MLSYKVSRVLLYLTKPNWRTSGLGIMPLQLLNLGVIIPRVLFRLLVTRTPRGDHIILLMLQLVKLSKQILLNWTHRLWSIMALCILRQSWFSWSHSYTASPNHSSSFLAPYILVLRTLYTNTSFFLVSGCSLWTRLILYSHWYSILQAIRVSRTSLAYHLRTSYLGRPHLPHLHVREFCFEEVLYTFVTCRTSVRVHCGLVGLHQQLIPRPDKICQLERSIWSTAWRRDWGGCTLANRTPGILVTEVPIIFMKLFVLLIIV